MSLSVLKENPAGCVKRHLNLFVTLNTALILFFLFPSEPSSVLRFFLRATLFQGVWESVLTEGPVRAVVQYSSVVHVLEYLHLLHLTKPKRVTLCTYFLPLPLPVLTATYK